jgi:hypothetical protein
MESYLTLMTHTAKGRKSVVDKGNVMENKSRGDAFALLEGGGDEGKGTGSRVKVAGRRSLGTRMGGPRIEESGDLESRVSEGVVVEGVKNDGLVDGRAGGAWERGEGTIGQVTTVPEINSSCIAMIGNETAVFNADKGKGVEVGGGVDEG